MGTALLAVTVAVTSRSNVARPSSYAVLDSDSTSRRVAVSTPNAVNGAGSPSSCCTKKLVGVGTAALIFCDDTQKKHGAGPQHTNNAVSSESGEGGAECRDASRRTVRPGSLRSDRSANSMELLVTFSVCKHHTTLL
jgi:hypothetical protein